VWCRTPPRFERPIRARRRRSLSCDRGCQERDLNRRPRSVAQWSAWIDIGKRHNAVDVALRRSVADVPCLVENGAKEKGSEAGTVTRPAFFCAFAPMTATIIKMKNRPFLVMENGRLRAFRGVGRRRRDGIKASWLRRKEAHCAQYSTGWMVFSILAVQDQTVEREGVASRS
jgi:hypothetical protein